MPEITIQFIGILKAVGRELFDTTVDFSILSIDFVNLPSGKKLQHVIFDVTMRLDGDDKLIQVPSVTVSQGDLPILEKTGFLGGCESFISPRLFCRLFPYHILFDDTLRIKQCGVTIQKMSHSKVEPGEIFNQFKKTVPVL